MEAVHHNSSDSDTNKNLSPSQAQVIAALAQGRTITDAARDAGLHRTTIHTWFRDQPIFKTAFEEAQREYVTTLQDGMRDLAARAVETLRSLLAMATFCTHLPKCRHECRHSSLERPLHGGCN